MKLIELHGKPVSGGEYPLICTPLVGRTRAAIVDELAAVLPKRPDIIEWRVDFFAGIADTAAVVEVAGDIRRAAGATPIIFTRRSMSEGGERVALDDEAIVELYVAVCASRCVDVIDYELGNLAANRARLRQASREAGIAMIMSYHNFQSTPPAADILGKYLDAERYGADIAKVAVMPQEAEDVLTLLAATAQASRACALPLIGMSMGGMGSLSRIYGWAYGSALTFAVGKSSSAPGQISIEDLRVVLALARNAMGRK